MRGIILDFSIQENTGYISGDDGKRYTFIGSEWKEQRAPQKGDYVDFDIDASGNAIQIFSISTFSTDHSVEDEEKHRERLLKEKNYTMQDWWHKCLGNYTTISGRARRAELWSFYLCQFCILFVLLVITAMGMILTTATNFYFPAFFSVCTFVGFAVFCIVYIGLLLPTIAVGARRLHDIGMSAYWLLLYFVPCGGFILLICFCIDTDPKENQWGLPAK